MVYQAHRVSGDTDLLCPEEAVIPITARKFAAALEAHDVGVTVTRSFGSFWKAVNLLEHTIDHQ